MAVYFFGADHESAKANLFRLLGYEITRDPRSPKSADVVRAFHLSEARERVVTAPARTSKSWSSAPEIVHAFFPMLEKESDLAAGNLIAAEADIHIWVIPPVYKLAKEWKYAREYLLDRGLVKAFGGKIETSTDAESQGNMQLTVLWPWKTRTGRPCRSTLQVRSAANEELLQAEEVKLAVISEAADQDERVVKKFLLTRCKQIIYPTTPKRSGLWLYERIQRGKERSELSIEHFEFDRFCNPTYDHERYAQARLEAEMTYGSAEADPDFMEQFEGQWTFAGGQVVPFRWLKTDDGPPPNVVETLPRWTPGATWAVAFDYGWDDPAVALFVAISVQGELCVASEIYQQHLTDEDLIERVRKRASDLGIRVDHYIPDPMRPVLTELLRRHGLPLFDRMPSSELRDRPAGFQALRSLFSVDPAVGRPRLTVLASCQRTIAELKAIRFKEGCANEYSKQALVGDDHAIDALRALAMSRVRAKERERDWLRDWQREQTILQRRKAMRTRYGTPLLGHAPGAFVEAR